jgi:hypothetical protein
MPGLIIYSQCNPLITIILLQAIKKNQEKYLILEIQTIYQGNFQLMKNYGIK